jgi:hypothetical protein
VAIHRKAIDPQPLDAAAEAIVRAALAWQLDQDTENYPGPEKAQALCEACYAYRKEMLEAVLGQNEQHLSLVEEIQRRGADGPTVGGILDDLQHQVGAPPARKLGVGNL